MEARGQKVERELQRTRFELEQLAGHLMRSQEDERRRISRELHDDIGQRLSLLAIDVDLLRQSLKPRIDEEQCQQLAQIKYQADTLASDVHELSHQLHSSRLQHLGLLSALEELVQRVGRQNQLKIELCTTGNHLLLTPEIALCFLRVCQEALHNVVRHSNAKNVSIHLDISDGAANLTIRDYGIGFDTSSINDGLGLISMRERLRIIGGEFGIDSHQSCGTILTAHVPMAGIKVAGTGCKHPESHSRAKQGTHRVRQSYLRVSHGGKMPTKDISSR